jgi:hypothetical protein
MMLKDRNDGFVAQRLRFRDETLAFDHGFATTASMFSLPKMLGSDGKFFDLLEASAEESRQLEWPPQRLTVAYASVDDGKERSESVRGPMSRRSLSPPQGD